MCMGRLTGDNMERVVYGDSKGCVVLMTCGFNELPARDLIYTGEATNTLSALKRQVEALR